MPKNCYHILFQNVRKHVEHSVSLYRKGKRPKVWLKETEDMQESKRGMADRESLS